MAKLTLLERDLIRASLDGFDEGTMTGWIGKKDVRVETSQDDNVTEVRVISEQTEKVITRLVVGRWFCCGQEMTRRLRYKAGLDDPVPLVVRCGECGRWFHAGLGPRDVEETVRNKVRTLVGMDQNKEALWRRVMKRLRDEI